MVAYSQTTTLSQQHFPSAPQLYQNMYQPCQQQATSSTSVVSPATLPEGCSVFGFPKTATAPINCGVMGVPHFQQPTVNYAHYVQSTVGSQLPVPSGVHYGSYSIPCNALPPQVLPALPAAACPSPPTYSFVYHANEEAAQYAQQDQNMLIFAQIQEQRQRAAGKELSLVMAQGCYASLSGLYSEEAPDSHAMTQPAGMPPALNERFVFAQQAYRPEPEVFHVSTHPSVFEPIPSSTRALPTAHHQPQHRQQPAASPSLPAGEPYESSSPQEEHTRIDKHRTLMYSSEGNKAALSIRVGDFSHTPAVPESPLPAASEPGREVVCAAKRVADDVTGNVGEPQPSLAGCCLPILGQDKPVFLRTVKDFKCRQSECCSFPVSDFSDDEDEAEVPVIRQPSTPSRPTEGKRRPPRKNDTFVGTPDAIIDSKFCMKDCKAEAARQLPEYSARRTTSTPIHSTGGFCASDDRRKSNVTWLIADEPPTSGDSAPSGKTSRRWQSASGVPSDDFSLNCIQELYGRDDERLSPGASYRQHKLFVDEQRKKLIEVQSVDHGLGLVGSGSKARRRSYVV